DPFFDYLDARMDFKDPPEHARLRGLATMAFTPRSVNALTPMIQTMVDEILDHATARGSMEFIRDLAFPLPGAVIAMMLGVPVADCGRLKQWSNEFVQFFKSVPSEATADDYRCSFAAARALDDYFREILKREPGNRKGLLSALAEAELGGDRLSEV